MAALAAGAAVLAARPSTPLGTALPLRRGATLSPSKGRPARPTALTIEITGAIDPPMAAYLKRALGRAEESKAAALLIRLNTPGGSLSATSEMTETLLTSPVPVIVYVAPSGARAASAGTFVTMAANVAAMAPGTVIGAAHPVAGSGQEIPEKIDQKIVNHAVSVIRAIAERRGRNADWAENAVRQSASVTAPQALKLRVIDVVAESQDDLFSALDGRKIELSPGHAVTLRLKGARPQPLARTIAEGFLHAIANPEIAYILLTIGFIGIVAELNHPGAVLPGVLGVISLVLAFYALSALELSYAAAALILLGIGLLVADIWVPSHGVFTVGGLASFVVGSIMLSGSAPPGLRIAWQMIVAMTALTGGFFILVVSLGIRAQLRRITTGQQGLVGRTAEVRTPLVPKGQVFVAGELWMARLEPAPGQAASAQPGETVVIERMEGLTLIVRKQG